MGLTRIDRTASRTRQGDGPVGTDRLAAVLDVPVADMTDAPRQLRAEIATAAAPTRTV